MRLVVQGGRELEGDGLIDIASRPQTLSLCGICDLWERGGHTGESLRYY